MWLFSKCECEVFFFGVGELEFMEVDIDLEVGLEEEVVGGLRFGVWVCFFG